MIRVREGFTRASLMRPVRVHSKASRAPSPLQTAGRPPRLVRQPSVELPSMAVASTKSRWETGEVQAQSAAKGPSCKVGPPSGSRLGSFGKAGVRLSRLQAGHRGWTSPGASLGLGVPRLGLAEAVWRGPFGL